jgi:hypothetical protein
LALFCLSTASVAAENAVLETHFKNYAASWGPNADMDAIAASYYLPEVTMFSRQLTTQLSGVSEIAGALRAALLPAIEAGWQGTSVVAFSSCQLRSDLALVGIDYERRFADGTSTPSSTTYIVVSTEGGWKIAAVMVSDHSDVSC